MKPLVRPATLEDVPQIDALAQGENLSVDAGRLLTERDARLYVAVERSSRSDTPATLLGFASLRDVADEVELLDLAVLPSARRQGVASALLAVAIGDSRVRGATALHLEVAGPNHAARGTYQKAGFAEVGVRRRYYRNGDDAVLMTLELR